MTLPGHGAAVVPLLPWPGTSRRARGSVRSVLLLEPGFTRT